MSDNLFSYYPLPTPPEGRRGDYSYLLKDNIHFTIQPSSLREELEVGIRGEYSLLP